MELWKRPNWNELIPEAKSDFRCGDCDKMKPWQQHWQSTQENICSICDDCKKIDDLERKVLSETPEQVEERMRQRIDAILSE